MEMFMIPVCRDRSRERYVLDERDGDSPLYGVLRRAARAAGYEWTTAKVAGAVHAILALYTRAAREARGGDPMVYEMAVSDSATVILGEGPVLRRIGPRTVAAAHAALDAAHAAPAAT